MRKKENAEGLFLARVVTGWSPENSWSLVGVRNGRKRGRGGHGTCRSLQASNEVLEFQTVRSEKAVEGFKWRE